MYKVLTIILIYRPTRGYGEKAHRLTNTKRVNVTVRNIPAVEPVGIFGAGNGEKRSGGIKQCYRRVKRHFGSNGMEKEGFRIRGQEQ